MLTATLVLLVAALSGLDSLHGPVALSPFDPLTALGLGILMLTAVLTVFFHRNRLKALMTLSTVGLIVSLLFARYSAPDLALTQLSVEVVTIILLVLALFFMPDRTPIESSSLRGLRDVLLAGGLGLLVALLAYAVLTRPYEGIGDFFLANSVSVAVATTWSTSSWWTSAASTPSARSPCWPSPRRASTACSSTCTCRIRWSIPRARPGPATATR